jgi:hypothetical protein
MKIINILLISILLLIIRCGYADNSCTRHIYNNSNKTQEIRTSIAGSNDYGFVSITTNDEVCFEGNTTCDITIPAGETATIVYYWNTDGGGRSSGDLTLSGQNQNNIHWDNIGGHGTALWQCPYIQHDGDTGAVYVNDPSNGDISW